MAFEDQTSTPYDDQALQEASEEYESKLWLDQTSTLHELEQALSEYYSTKSRSESLEETLKVYAETKDPLVLELALKQYKNLKSPCEIKSADVKENVSIIQSYKYNIMTSRYPPYIGVVGGFDPCQNLERKFGNLLWPDFVQLR